MNRLKTWLAKSLLIGLATLGAGAHAQTLDTPLRIVVGYPPGGVTDRTARIVSDKLQKKLGVPVVVDNKPGAGGRLAAQQVKSAGAGQNVLLLANPPSMVLGPMIQKDSGYDPERDFVPVSRVNDYEIAIAVAAAVPVRELSHLMAWLRANPDQANFGVPATGSLPHFFTLLLGEKAGVKTQVVGYRGSGPLLTDLMGGQVPVAIDSLDSLMPQHEAGKLRILAVSTAKRSPYAKNIPTFREAGIDLVSLPWNAFFAPASMPRDKVRMLSQAIQSVMQDPEVQAKFTDARTTPVVNNLEQTAAAVQAFRNQWAPVVKKSGLAAD